MLDANHMTVVLSVIELVLMLGTNSMAAVFGRTE